MKKLNKKYNYNRSIPKMGGGGMPQWGENGQANAQAIAGFTGMMSPLLGEGSRGAGALSGASTGASMGAALGPIGMGVGAVLGGTLGLIGAGKQKREEEKFAKEQAIVTSKAYGNQFNSQLDTNNQNAYGNTQRFAEGGDTSNDDTLITSKKGNKLSKSGWSEIQKKGIWSNPEEYMNYIDGWAKPNATPITPQTPMANFNGAGGKFSVPAQDFINYMQDPNVNNKTYVTKPWNLSDPTKIQQQLDQYQRIDGTGLEGVFQGINKYYPKMEQGGQVEPNIINIEKGELQINPSTGKILREYKGINPETGGLYEPHKKKGKDTDNNIVSAEENTFIITKKEAPNYKKAIDNNDKLHLESIKMNIRNNKDAKMGTYKMGSFVKYADGDKVGRNPFTSKQDLINFQNAQGLNPDGLWGKNSSASYYSPINTTPINQINMPANNFQIGSPLGTSSVNTGMASSYNPNLGNGFGNIANNLLQYAPSIANIGQGLFGKVETNSKVQAQVNPFQNQVLNNMPQEVSAQPIIDELYANTKSQFRNIDNKTSSSSIARANKNNLFGNYQNRLADIRMNVSQANNGIKAQRGSIYNNLGQQQVSNNLQAQNTNFNIDQINSQNKAAKTNMLNTGFSQLQQTYMNNQKNDQLYNTDMYKAKLLGEMFPNSKFYNELFGSETLSKLGRRG